LGGVTGFHQHGSHSHRQGNDEQRQTKQNNVLTMINMQHRQCAGYQPLLNGQS
jgi:hypothetical protein